MTGTRAGPARMHRALRLNRSKGHHFLYELLREDVALQRNISLGRFPDVAEIHPSNVALVALRLGVDTGPIADRLGRAEPANATELRLAY